MILFAWESCRMSASILCHLHFWTFNTLSPATVSHTGIHGYHHKVASSSKIDIGTCRKEWSEGRSVSWSLSNQRPCRLRDQLKECEEMISSQRILCVKWKTLRHLLIMLESGVLILYTICKQSGDIEGIIIDRSLITRLDGKLDKALILDSSILLLYAHSNRVSLVYINQNRRASTVTPPTSLTLNHDNIKRNIEKISCLDLKFSHVNVRGLPDHRVERHMITNNQKDVVSIWWRDVLEDGIQWSSLADGESDNMTVIRIKGNGKLEVYVKIQTKLNPVCALYSKLHANLLYCVMTSDDCNYELHSLDCSTTVHKSNIDAIVKTNGNVTAFSLNNNESLLMLGCDNGTMVLYDLKKDCFKTATAFFSPITTVCWHPAGNIVFVTGLHGEIQCVDASLNSIHFTLCNEECDQTPLLELNSYFMSPIQLEYVGWGSEPRQGEGHGGCYDNVVLVFNHGPVVLIRLELGVISKGRLGNTEILCEFLRYKQYSQAKDLLINHDHISQELLTIFMDHFLSLPLISTHEEIIESVLMNCMNAAPLKNHIAIYTKRFFFKLLQHQKLEKALRLAIDMSEKDIFMDLYHVAVRCNETALAELCQQRAEQIAATVDKREIIDDIVQPVPEEPLILMNKDNRDQQQSINIVNFGYFS